MEPGAGDGSGSKLEEDGCVLLQKVLNIVNILICSIFCWVPEAKSSNSWYDLIDMKNESN